MSTCTDSCCAIQSAQQVKDWDFSARFIACEKVEAEKQGTPYDFVVESEVVFDSLYAFIYRTEGETGAKEDEDHT